MILHPLHPSSNSAAIPEFVTFDVELNYIVLVGKSVVLDCMAAGVPTPTYNWSVSSSSLANKLTPWDSAEITVEFTESKEYTCIATNEHGSISRVFTLFQAGRWSHL